MSTLAIWHEDKRIGTLEWKAPEWFFTYDTQWIKNNGFVLSPHFPLQAHTFEGNKVLWFFQNLLPEGRILETIALREGVRRENIFALLNTLGRECAGSLTIIPDSEAPPQANQHYRELTDKELLSWSEQMQTIPLAIATPDARMSLAGAQEKIAVHMKEGKLFLPTDCSPTTYILKPQNLSRDRYPHCVANEFFCMQLAKHMPLSVPTTQIYRIDDTAFYLIERYDRRQNPDGLISRIHQNDLCQVLDKWPDYKYEELGGAMLSDYFQAIDNYADKPAPDKLALLRWIIFNYLIGNSDAHAKNVSFLMQNNALHLAPFYDFT